MVLLGVEMAVGRGEFDGGWGGRDGLAAPGMEDSILVGVEDAGSEGGVASHWVRKMKLTLRISPDASLPKLYMLPLTLGIE